MVIISTPVSLEDPCSQNFTGVGCPSPDSTANCLTCFYCSFKVTSLHEKQQNLFQILISYPDNNKKGVLNLTAQSQKLLVVPNQRHGEALSLFQLFTKKSEAYLKCKTVTLAPPTLLFLDFHFSNLRSSFFLLVGQQVHFSLCFPLDINELLNYTALYSAFLRQKQKEQQCKLIIEINKSWYIALCVVNRSIEKLFLIDCVNIYFTQSTLDFRVSTGIILSNRHFP